MPTSQDDYYSYAPRVTLDRPLALIGFLGAETSKVGHILNAHLGVPVFDVPRQLEHAVGMSSSQLWVERGEPSLRLEESKQIQLALEQTPPPVIVLGEGSLIEPMNRRTVASRCSLVYIRRPLEEAMARVRKQTERTPSSIPQFAIFTPETDDQWREALHGLWLQHKDSYENASHIVDADTLPAPHVAHQVAEIMGWAELMPDRKP
jgi:shikimate kinase